MPVQSEFSEPVGSLEQDTQSPQDEDINISSFKIRFEQQI